MKVPANQKALSLAACIAGQYGKLPQVAAVALAGSQTNLVADPGSDIDLYVYWETPIPMESRRSIANTDSTAVELDNQFWETGDEWFDAPTGIHVDVMFRHTGWIEAQLARLLDHHQASVGYSTCFWHNVRSSHVLYDCDGWFAGLQDWADQPFPEPLRRNIVAKNYPILRDTASSYLYQIKSAAVRGDKISIHHRIAALLASYFDILFAVNRLPHPGEKRLLQIANSKCTILPPGMEHQVLDLLAASGNPEAVVAKADALISGLADLLREQGLVGREGERL
ncbi:MAG: DUF4037 domain-containing protein [Calditrichaeota bacterium]|nr:DUF4037 domain-containing protein [Calditrichota bacterium]